LIVNAFPREFKDFKDFQDHEIADFVNAAFLNQLLIANAAVKKMIENDFGRIIIINSKANTQGYSSGSLYCSLKSAWMAFHEALAKELSFSGKNVSITTICPDSFTDAKGNNFRHYAPIIKAIEKRMLVALMTNKSAIYYALTFKNRIVLTCQAVKRILNIW
jgi:short-subunit dehydrogenase